MRKTRGDDLSRVVPCEGINEAMIDTVDAALSQPIRLVQHYSEPLFQAVYHEVADTYAFFVNPTHEKQSFTASLRPDEVGLPAGAKASWDLTLEPGQCRLVPVE